MSTSITASNANAPFSNYLLSDANYTLTMTSFPAAGATASMGSLSFPNFEPPTSGKFAIAFSNTALTNTSNSLVTYVTLNESTDNATWAPVATSQGTTVFSSSCFSVKDNAGSVAASTTPALVYLPPKQKCPTYYIQPVVTVPSGGATAGGITGSITVQALF